MATGILYLDGPRLQRCLIAGLQKLIADREYLNNINVFPVPDGDTGNNLAQTASAACSALAADSAETVSAVLRTLADAALDSAQGNSGALLAQFFQGIASSLSATERLLPEQFTAACISAAEYTRSALENPREGTILTVIDAAAAAAKSTPTDDFAQLLPAMLAAANEALQGTTAQLAELRKAGVVDAGAAGFCDILSGCSEFMLTGSLRNPQPVAAPTTTAKVRHEQVTDLEYRYCTECMLVGTALEAAQVRTDLHAFGNSLVVAGSAQRLKIHIHTNEPEQLFKFAARYGEVQKTKADDMIGQARSLNRNDRDIAIITDSAADIPDEVVSSLNIHVVPLRVQFGDESHLDKIGMKPADFLAELKSNPNTPGTSQPTQGDFRRMYDFLTTHFEEVVGIHLSSKLSGTWQGALTTSEQATHKNKIHLYDSANISVGQGLIVKRAAEHAAAGMHGDTLHNHITADIAHMRTFALVTDLSNAVRSGRVKPLIKHVADFLRLTPVLTSTGEGKVGVHGFIPGRFRLTERFARYVVKATGKAGNWDVAIAHSKDTLAAAERLEQELLERLEHVNDVWRTDIGPALGVHAGMEALVVALIKSERSN